MLILQTGDSILKTRNGQEVTVLKEINEPDLEHDEDVLPMLKVKFLDGHITEVWPDELKETTTEQEG